MGTTILIFRKRRRERSVESDDFAWAMAPPRCEGTAGEPQRYRNEMTPSIVNKTRYVAPPTSR
jgi:hypothetical protein